MGQTLVKAMDTTYLNKYGLEKRDTFFLWEGWFPENNAHVLIEAFNQLNIGF